MTDSAAEGPVNGAVGGGVADLADKTASQARRVAAIDCGTNSLRLLIADVSPARGELTDVQRRMEIVRLGQGVDATGRLAPAALRRTFGVLREFAGSIREHGATAVAMVATSATRDASNAAEFAAGVTDILGVSPQVISGEREAGLSFTGATGWLAAVPDLPPPYLVVDIGGGSTEFVTGSPDGQAAPAAISLDLGCVRLTERHLHSDPPTAAEIAAASAEVDAAIDTAVAAVPAAAARTLVGVAGTVTTVAAMYLGLPGYDAGRIHEARVPAAELHQIAARLLGQTRAERALIGPMHAGRVDVIGGGVLILDRIVERLGFGQVVASERDALDAMAWELAADAG